MIPAATEAFMSSSRPAAANVLLVFICNDGLIMLDDFFWRRAS